MGKFSWTLLQILTPPLATDSGDMLPCYALSQTSLAPLNLEDFISSGRIRHVVKPGRFGNNFYLGAQHANHIHELV